MIRAVAPGAQIVDYEAPLGWSGFVEALKRINDDNRASIVSVSWGACFAHLGTGVREEMQVELERAEKAGRTVFVASGDAGAYSCLHREGELDPTAHVETVDWPAASPSVVAVGGTRLSLTRDRGYFGEEGWEDTLSSQGTGGLLGSEEATSPRAPPGRTPAESETSARRAPASARRCGPGRLRQRLLRGLFGGRRPGEDADRRPVRVRDERPRRRSGRASPRSSPSTRVSTGSGSFRSSLQRSTRSPAPKSIAERSTTSRKAAT